MLDWSGQVCVIVASGPSAKDEDLSKLKDKCKFIVINNSWELAPWAEVLYASDGRWWSRNERVIREFAGLKYTQDRFAAQKWGLNLVAVTKGNYDLATEPGKIGVGGNSGFHAVNLACHFRPKRIVLVGYDMTSENGLHWHPDHPRGTLSNPREGSLKRWRRILDNVAPAIAGLGIECLNASAKSALEAYQKVPLMEAVNANR